MSEQKISLVHFIQARNELIQGLIYSIDPDRYSCLFSHNNYTNTPLCI